MGKKGDRDVLEKVAAGSSTSLNYPIIVIIENRQWRKDENNGRMVKKVIVIYWKR